MSLSATVCVLRESARPQLTADTSKLPRFYDPDLTNELMGDTSEEFWRQVEKIPHHLDIGRQVKKIPSHLDIGSQGECDNWSETDCGTAVSNLRHNCELLLWMHTPLTPDVVLVVRREGSSKDIYIIVS